MIRWEWRFHLVCIDRSHDSTHSAWLYRWIFFFFLCFLILKSNTNAAHGVNNLYYWSVVLLFWLCYWSAVISLLSISFVLICVSVFSSGVTAAQHSGTSLDSPAGIDPKCFITSCHIIRHVHFRLTFHFRVIISW